MTPCERFVESEVMRKPAALLDAVKDICKEAYHLGSGDAKAVLSDAEKLWKDGHCIELSWRTDPTSSITHYCEDLQALIRVLAEAKEAGIRDIEMKLVTPLGLGRPS